MNAELFDTLIQYVVARSGLTEEDGRDRFGRGYRYTGCILITMAGFA